MPTPPPPPPPGNQPALTAETSIAYGWRGIENSAFAGPTPMAGDVVQCITAQVASVPDSVVQTIPLSIPMGIYDSVWFRCQFNSVSGGEAVYYGTPTQPGFYNPINPVADVPGAYGWIGPTATDLYQLADVNNFAGGTMNFYYMCVGSAETDLVVTAFLFTRRATALAYRYGPGNF